MRQPQNLELQCLSLTLPLSATLLPHPFFTPLTHQLDPRKAAQRAQANEKRDEATHSRASISRRATAPTTTLVGSL